MASSKQVVLITGANRGIGYQIAEILLQSKHAYTILVGSRNEAAGDEAVTKLNATKSNAASTIAAIQIDLTSVSSIAAAVDKVKSDHGHLDILINNAAIPSTSATLSTPTAEDWRRVFETNVFGTVAVTQAFLPLLLLSPSPKLITLSSSIGSLTLTEQNPPHPLMNSATPYRASKAAINSCIIEWNKLYAPKGVGVWGVDPGLCATDFGGEWSRKNGRDPREGADIVRQCMEGEREDAKGKVVWEQGGQTGVRPW